MKKFSIIFSFVALIVSCATITSPSGGEKDADPPQLIFASPEIGNTNFSGRSFVVKFDEFINQVDFANEILVSPKIESLKSVYLGNKIKFSWKEDLKENTTYIFQFLSQVSDLNEKNILPGFMYTFSTGDVIDSLSISGHINNVTYTPSDELNVNLVTKEDFTDTTYLSGGFNFATISNKEGHFDFKYLPLDEFYIYGFEDLNGNKKWDEREERIAFFPHTIESSDSTHVAFDLFLEEIEPSIINAKHSAFNKVELVYEGEMPNMDGLSFYSNQEEVLFETKITNEIVELVFNQSTVEDSLSILHQGDTLPFFIVPYEMPNIELEVVSEDIIKGEKFILKSNYPIDRIDTSKVKTFVNGDSLVNYEVKLSEDQFSLEFVLADSDLPINVVVKDSALVYQDSVINLMFNHSVIRKSLEDYSVIQCAFPSHQKPLIVQLHTKDDVLIEEKYLTIKESKTSFERVLPGQYKLKYIIDENMDGKFTTGSVKLLRQPEKSVIYSGNLQLKPNWITEIVFP